MKKILLILFLIPLLVSAAEVNDFIVVTSNSSTSLDIKDIVRGDLIREYGNDYFTIYTKDLPKINDVPFLSFEKNDKVITITPEQLSVDNNIIKLDGDVIYMPYTDYLLDGNLRVYNYNGILILQDNNFNIKTEEVNIKDGIIYLHDTRMPIKIMPYMITYRLRQITNDKIEQMEIYSNKDALEYRYKLKLEGKLFGIWKKSMDSSITVDAIKGTIKINKPWWAIFSTGENSLFNGFDIKEFYGY